MRLQQSIRKEEQGTLQELEGCKDMNDEYNGQEGIGTTLVETRYTRNKDDQIRTTLRLKRDARLDKMKRT